MILNLLTGRTLQRFIVIGLMIFILVQLGAALESPWVWCVGALALVLEQIGYLHGMTEATEVIRDLTPEQYQEIQKLLKGDDDK